MPNITEETIKERIKKELNGTEKKDLINLYLDNCKIENFEALSDGFDSLESISLINTSLSSLEGFPTLANLKVIDLSANNLTGGLKHLTKNMEIAHINLCSNKIEKLEELEPLKELDNLKSLDTFDNPISFLDNYREAIFKMLPQLTYLDGADKTGTEMEMTMNTEAEDDDGEDGAEDEDNDRGLSILNDPEACEDDDSEDFVPPSEEEVASRGVKRKHPGDEE
ncbi:Acidic leucine-rich nuclear phosphoprotein 32 family member A [Strongyloides ratti]|uniref:Acidic leucine-rich nuclear phosphoprotein 32 family member A n=1 Tax=Strongyloides ratti TaxID=34506 RepID=A0A090LHM9_STRRB|nr:Acidic leucine-rich nuclear phosphoprotein 32 family member A [Strongyloides ratti]CEF67020.1 Acidic leucine-rich nuclear phosphoprotein 32 family member A [Strongyloides ratti]